MERVIAYVDGYNLYYGLRSKGWRKFYWLNIQKLAQRYLKPHQTLVKTKYFTATIKKPESRRLRQLTYLEALQTLPDFQIYYGQFLSETITCRQCGHSYTTYHEKMTDINISVQIMQDAFEDNFDTAFLMSADSDLTPPVKTIHQLFHDKKVISIFPPARTSYSLKQASKGVLHIGRAELAQCLFPEQVRKDSVLLTCPPSWK